MLSSSVSVAILHFLDDKASETAIFCKIFDSFFDCMNVRSLHEGGGGIKRKPNLKPYTSPDDDRFEVGGCPKIILYVQFFIINSN